ncbi:MAG: hypothetical protein SPI63_07960 [Bulleidia sp.]|nr:hypothetical protein [Bulleidia sp.]
MRILKAILSIIITITFCILPINLNKVEVDAAPTDSDFYTSSAWTADTSTAVPSTFKPSASFAGYDRTYC